MEGGSNLPEHPGLYGEQVLVDPRGGHTHAKNVLHGWDVILGKESVQVIEITGEREGSQREKMRREREGGGGGGGGGER